MDEEEFGGVLASAPQEHGQRLNRECLDRAGFDGFYAENYDLHINFPGGTPIDGPSAGIAMATAIVSAMKGIEVDNKVAMTGEMSIHGKVKPIGGVIAKVEAAFQAGATRVIIPKDNWQTLFQDLSGGLRVIPVESVDEVFGHILAERSLRRLFSSCKRGISILFRFILCRRRLRVTVK